MTTIEPRIVKVRIGPPGQQGREWTGPLFIEFGVKKTSGSKPNEAEVKLHNLSDDSRQWIERPGQVIQILAGQGIASALFYGDVKKRGVGTKRQGPDLITHIKAADGQRRFREATFTKSYPPSTSRDTIISDVLAALGLALGHRPSLPAVVFPRGWAWAGTARSALDCLLAIDGYGWSIQDNAVFIVKYGSILPGSAQVISEATGMRGTPDRKDKGVEVTTILTPSIRPGSLVRLESKIVSGDFKAAKVDHKGTSRGLEWTTKILAVPHERQ